MNAPAPHRARAFAEPLVKLATALRTYRLSRDTMEIANSRVAAIWALEKALEWCEELALHPFGGSLIVNGRPLVTAEEDADAVRMIAVECEARGIGWLVFAATPTPSDMAALLGGWDYCTTDSDPFLALQTRLEQAGVTAIRIGRAGPRELDTAPLLDPERYIQQTYFDAIDVAKLTFAATRLGQSLTLSPARRVIQRLVDIMLNGEDRDRDRLFLLTTVKNFGGYQVNHAVNTCVLALGLGHGIQLPRETLRDLGFAALFGDIGAATDPNRVAETRSLLSDEDWNAMSESPPMGVAALCRGQELDTTLVRGMLAALSHHKHWDGGGYPKKLEVERGLLDDIIAVADRYDAMTTARPYRTDPLPPADAIEELMAMAGTLLDPLVVKLFVHWAGTAPVGSLVLTDGGQVGIIVATRGRLGHEHVSIVQCLDSRELTQVPSARVMPVDELTASAMMGGAQALDQACMAIALDGGAGVDPGRLDS